MILEIERELWSALIDVAKGAATIPRVQAALVCIEAIVQTAEIAEVSGWFSSEPIHYS